MVSTKTSQFLYILVFFKTCHKRGLNLGLLGTRGVDWLRLWRHFLLNFSGFLGSPCHCKLVSERILNILQTNFSFLLERETTQLSLSEFLRVFICMPLLGTSEFDGNLKCLFADLWFWCHCILVSALQSLHLKKTFWCQGIDCSPSILYGGVRMF